MLDPYHDWGNSTYQVEVDIDPQRVELAGLSNREVAESLNGLIAGYTADRLPRGRLHRPGGAAPGREERSDLCAACEGTLRR